MTDSNENALAQALGAIAGVLGKLDKKLDDLIAAQPLKVDPAKLVASTQGITSQLQVVDTSKRPALVEPNPNPTQHRPCSKCGTMFLYKGEPHC